jgi:hypothetical protein
MEEIKNKGGRPRKVRKWRDPAGLKRAIDAYFSECEATGKTPYLTSLHLSLGVWNGYFARLIADDDRYSHVVKSMYERMAEQYEINTSIKKMIPALGIFMLKNCSYADRVDLNANVSSVLSLADLAKEARASGKQ